MWVRLDIDNNGRLRSARRGGEKGGRGRDRMNKKMVKKTFTKTATKAMGRKREVSSVFARAKPWNGGVRNGCSRIFFGAWFLGGGRSEEQDDVRTAVFCSREIEQFQPRKAGLTI